VFFHEEASSLLEKGGTVVDHLMQLFDTTDKVERHLREYRAMSKLGQTPPNRVVKPAIGAVFCLTLSSSERTLTPDHFEGGLASRCLWLMGEADVDRFLNVVPGCDPEGRARLIERWIQLGAAHAGRRLRGDGTVAPLSKECQDVILPLFELYKQATQEGNSARGSIYMRGIGLCQTIGTVYALSCGRLEVSVADLTAALRLVEHSMATTGHLQHTSQENVIYKLAERSIALIQRAGTAGMTRTQLNRNHLHVDAETLDRVQRLFEDSGEVFVSKPRTGQRGRPGEVYLHTDFVTAKSNVIEFRKAPEEAAADDTD